VRVAHVTDFYLPRLGGIEMQVADLAARQAAAGYDVEVLTSSPGGPDAGPVGVRRHTDGRRPAHPLHPGAVLAGVTAATSGDYDVVHAHLGVGSPLSFLAARAAARAGIPTVVTVHSLWAWVRPVFVSLDAVGRWTSSPIEWTAVSEAAAGPVRSLLPPGRTVGVIANGIDADDWRVEPLPRTDGEVLVVAVMRLAARKRPLPLLRMIREAQERLGDGVRLRLVVAGDGPERPKVERYIRRHGLTGQVELAGRLSRDEIRRLYARADVFVAPADLESFGIAALEARCAGLPVLAKASGGVREFVRSGREGLLAATDADMVDHLVRLAADPALRGVLARHNRTTPCPVSWDAVLRDTAAAYGRAGAVGAEIVPPAVEAAG
jgi:glycosyltransferase involved in cell wall biosynthesis